MMDTLFGISTTYRETRDKEETTARSPLGGTAATVSSIPFSSTISPILHPPSLPYTKDQKAIRAYHLRAQHHYTLSTIDIPEQTEISDLTAVQSTSALGERSAFSLSRST